jgi:hypothetical protein
MRRCLCRTYPGCKNVAEQDRKLCSICRGEGHRAYTERQLVAGKKKLKREIV